MADQDQLKLFDVSDITTSFYCRHCEKFLPLDNFNKWSITHNNHTCKNCRRNLPTYVNRKKATVNQLGIKCSCGCGELTTEFKGVVNKYIKHHKNRFGLRKGQTRTAEAVLEAIKIKTVIADDDHWLWSGSKNTAGYGVITFNKKQALVRRVVYALLRNNGIFTDSQLKNTCGNRFCCNPGHLVEFTKSE